MQLPQSMVDFGCSLKEYSARAGESYYKLVYAEGPVEWQGKHSVFVDVTNGNGRAIGQPVRFFWNNGQDIKAVEPKTGEEFGVDFPMYAANNAYGVAVMGTSDVVWGMGLIPFKPHVVFKLKFALTIAGTQPSDGSAGANVLKYLQEARAAIDKAERAYRG